MATYAIGDVHGCLGELKKLLKRIKYKSDADHLWFVGDLINRGPDSLGVLRFVHAMGANATVMVGNHEAKAIESFVRADAHGTNGKSKHPVGYLLQAPDGDKLFEWMRGFPVFRRDKKRNCAMVHAGLHPDWSLKEAARRSKKLGKIFRSDKDLKAFFEGYGSELPRDEGPDDDLETQLRFTLMVMTRARLVASDGRLIYPQQARSLGLTPYGFPPEESPIQPWFTRGRWLEEAKKKKLNILYGHWAALGLQFRHPTYGLDSGGVYGRRLTALRIDHPKHGLILHQVETEMYKEPTTDK